MPPSHDSLQSELEESLRFETLLIDLSARFVNVPADQVDSEIEDAQRRVCECLRLDASLLWQWSSPPSARLTLTHMHRPLGGPPVPAPEEVRTALPWSHAQLLAGRMYVHSTLDDLPAEADLDRETFQRHGIKSNVGLPLNVGGGAPVGALTFNTTRAHRAWTAAIVRRLQLVGQIFANALARKVADAEAQLRLRQLVHLNRVATMGELSATLAHELNQPLGAILRNAETAELLLQSAAPDLDELRAIVADIKRDEERAGAVIDRLRALLRRRRIEPRPTDLVQLVDETIGLVISDATARGIRIVSEVTATTPAARCDRVHVQQVLLNLIVNGMDAIGEAADGQARVTLRARPAGNGQIELCVSDTGHGIAPENLPSIFDPFFTTKTCGMGMGLAISRTLVEAHGGTLWAGEPAGCGASLQFHAAGRACREPALNAPTATVHLVDDDSSFRAAAARLLRARGFAVRPFASAAALLAQVSPETRGCVVADLRMPGLGGLDLQDALAQACPSLPIVFLTGQGDIPSTVRAMRGGAEDFLEKRCPQRQLIDAVNRALSREAGTRAERTRIQALRSGFDVLTARERQVLTHVVRGRLNKQIAAALGIHERTVKLHRTAITTKLKVHSAVELAELWRAAGLPDGDGESFPKGQ